MTRAMALLFVAVLMLTAGSINRVAAQDTFVVVPDAPGGATFTGCYRGDPRLWGQYRLHFCLNQRGNYWVDGAGLSCDGRLTWRTRNAEILITINRTSCGRGVAWERATMTCRGGSLIGAIIGQLLSPGSRPRLQTLRCTYHPTVRGYRDQQITARRTD